MTAPCASCGSSQLAAIHFPDHHETEAIVCLTCGALQPASQPTGRRPAPP